MKWVVVFAVVVALPLAGAAGQTTQPNDGISRWLADLGADDWKVRERAEAELVKYGPDAVPALQGIMKASQDPEVQERAQQALREIAGFMYPAFVTVHLRQTPAKEAFAEIAAAAHVELPAADDDLWSRTRPMPVVTLEADRMPFWEAVAEACRQTHLTLKLDTADFRTVELTPGEIGHPSDKSPVLGMTPVPEPLLDGESVNVKFPMMAEPDVRVLEYPLLWSFEEAVDTAHADHTFDPPTVTDAWESGHWVMALLHMGASPRRLVELRVKAAVVLETSAARLVVADFAKLTTATVMDNGIRITATRRALPHPGFWEVDVSVTPGPMPPEEEALIDRYFKDSTRLLDDQGRPFFPLSSELSTSRGTMTRQFIFSRHGTAPTYRRGEPSRLLVELPTASREDSVPLSWEDVGLENGN